MKTYKNIGLFGICFYFMLVFAGCKKENEFKHNDAAPITIDQILPEKGSGGTSLLINGSNFTTDTSKVKVTINGKPLKVIAVNGRQMMVVIPKKAGSGPIMVSIGDKTASSSKNFTYDYTRTVTTLAGSGVAGFANGPAADAMFNFSGESWYRSNGIVVDDDLNVYVADPGNHCVRKIDAQGNVSTFAGNPNSAGHEDGKGTAAKFSLPYGLAIDQSGTIYCVDPGNWDIRKITSDGTAVTFAWGSTEPWCITFDKKTGNLFYTGWNPAAKIYQVTPDAVTTEVASGFNYPSGLAFDANGNLFVSLFGDHVIKKLAAGSWSGSVFAGSGTIGWADGAATAARFAYPWGIAIDSGNNVYVAGNGANGGDVLNPDQSIRYVDGATQEVSTFAGSSVAGYINGIGKNAAFSAPSGVAIDKNGTVYVLDKNNNRIRKIVSE